MKSLFFNWATVFAVMLTPCGKVWADGPVEVLPGVWRFTFGETEKTTPVKTRHYPPAADGSAELPKLPECPLNVTASISDRGVLVHAPLADGEMIYGLGLQFQSFQQRGHKKKLRVNADPAMDTGDSHAPVPFYVTTRGYGVFIDTARYATFYLGDTKSKPGGANGEARSNRAEVLVEIPRAAGADVYVFGGPSLGEAVQRYNLFSGDAFWHFALSQWQRYHCFRLTGTI